MTLLSFGWLRRGWSLKLPALGGLAFLAWLGGPAPWLAGLATGGAALTNLGVARRPGTPFAVLFQCAFCSFFAGLAATLLQSSLHWEWGRLYLASLAFMVITQDELPERRP